MAYNIPDDETLADSIFAVMYRNPVVRSQKVMVDLVSKELSKKGNYRASGERIRKLAVKRKLAKIEMTYNNFDSHDVPDICPVCKSKMTSVYNKTLYDQTIEVKRKCSACSYSVGMKKRLPGHYTFVRRKRRK